MARSNETQTQLSANESISPPRWQSIVSGLVLVLATFVVFSPAFKAGYIWSDDEHVFENELLPAADGLYRIWFDPLSLRQYYPLVHSTYWLEYRVWGFDPAGYHIVNVILHASAAVLLWLALRQLKIEWAWFAALLFAIHPVQVESVAWITERKNVLSGFFAMASFLAYVKFLQRRKSDEAQSRKTFYFVALLCFVCALLSKTTAAMLPAVLALVIWWKVGRVSRHDFVPLVPMFVVGVLLGFVAVYLERLHVGADGIGWDFTFVERCLVAGRALCFYPSKLLLPTSLAFQYPKWSPDAGSWWQYLFPVACGGTAFVLWLQRGSLGRGPLTAVLAFAALLFPALGFFNVYAHRYSFVADHFQYLACIPLLVLGASLLADIARRGVNHALFAKSAAATIVLVLGILAWRQCQCFTDEETLYRETLARNPDAWFVCNSLGYMMLQRGDTWEARTLFERCLEIESGSIDRHIHLSNLGLAHATSGNWETAIKYYDESLALRQESSESHANRGLALLRLERPDEAIASLIRAVELEPERIAYRLSLADALATEQRIGEAVAILRGTAALAPFDADVRFRLARALGWDRDFDAAIRELVQAIRMNPNIPHWHAELGILYARSSDWQQAIQATQFASQLAEAIGDTDQAEQFASRVAELQQLAEKESASSGGADRSETEANSK